MKRKKASIVLLSCTSLHSPLKYKQKMVCWAQTSMPDLEKQEISSFFCPLKHDIIKWVMLVCVSIKLRVDRYRKRKRIKSQAWTGAARLPCCLCCHSQPIAESKPRRRQVSLTLGLKSLQAMLLQNHRSLTMTVLHLGL